MFDEFKLKYKQDNDINEIIPDSFWDKKIYSNISGFKDFMINYSGVSFNQGIFRVHSYKHIDKWSNLTFNAFPEYKNNVYVFAYDWLGTQFAFDLKGEIYLFEVGTGEVLETTVNLIDFIEKELVLYPEDSVALDFFNEYKKQYKYSINLLECVGYKVPLFLNGQDDCTNLEVIDMEVYWSICSDLYKGIKKMKDGDTVKRISL